MRTLTTRRAVTLAIAVSMITVLSVGPASGIVYGEPDAGEHPYVGSIVLHLPDFPEPGEDTFLQWCSGTLLDGIDGDVFLTAAHCVVGIDELLEPFPGAEVLVTFDETIDPGGNFHTGEIHAHPDFASHGMADLFDVAVIELDDAPNVGYGQLPEAGLLDDMKKSGELKHQQFTAVGYGSVRETRKKAFASIDFDNLSRNKADQSFLSLTSAWITLSMNQATGNGGTCYGDSGGPHFLAGTNVVVSLTVTGDTPCKATDKTYRIDTASARDFLDAFVPLP